MKWRVYKKEPIIFFNGEPLPMFSLSLSSAAVPMDLPEDTGNWWFTFGYCLGAERRESSSIVNEMCRQLKQALMLNPKEALAKAEVVFRREGFDPRQVYEGWISALDRITELTCRYEHSVWEAPWDPSNIEEVELAEDFFR